MLVGSSFVQSSFMISRLEIDKSPIENCISMENSKTELILVYNADSGFFMRAQRFHRVHTSVTFVR